VFAPTTVEEMQRWVNNELSFWGWVQQINVGSHQTQATHGVNSLSNASNAAHNAVQLFAAREESRWRNEVEQVHNHVRAAFVNYRLPHSSTPTAQRAAALKSEPHVAIAYLRLDKGKQPIV
jgi:hypothetical protein